MLRARCPPRLVTSGRRLCSSNPPSKGPTGGAPQKIPFEKPPSISKPLDVKPLFDTKPAADRIHQRTKWPLGFLIVGSGALLFSAAAAEAPEEGAASAPEKADGEAAGATVDGGAGDAASSDAPPAYRTAKDVLNDELAAASADVETLLQKPEEELTRAERYRVQAELVRRAGEKMEALKKETEERLAEERAKFEKLLEEKTSQHENHISEIIDLQTQVRDLEIRQQLKQREAEIKQEYEERLAEISEKHQAEFDYRILRFDERYRVETEEKVQQKAQELKQRFEEELLRNKELVLKTYGEERMKRHDVINAIQTELDAIEGITKRHAKLREQGAKVVELYTYAFTLARQLRTNEPFVKALKPLQKSDDPLIKAALATIPAEIAASGLPTTHEISDRFQNVKRACRRAGQVPEGGGMWYHIFSTVSAALTYPPEHAIEGTSVDAVLSRAEAKLVVGDLEGAARELEAGLARYEWPATLATDWIKMVDARLTVEQAVECVQAHALALSCGLVD